MIAKTIALPAFLASALINGDTSSCDCAGLSRGEHAPDCDLMRWVKAAIDYCAPGRIASCEGEAYFAHWCELPGYRLAGDVLEYTVLYPEDKDK